MAYDGVRVEGKLLGAEVAPTLCRYSDNGDLLRPWDVPLLTAVGRTHTEKDKTKP